MYALFSQQINGTFALDYGMTKAGLVLEDVLFIPGDTFSNQILQFNEWLESARIEEFDGRSLDEQFLWKNKGNRFSIWRSRGFMPRNLPCFKKIQNGVLVDLGERIVYSCYKKYSLVCSIENGMIRRENWIGANLIPVNTVQAIESMSTSDAEIIIHTKGRNVTLLSYYSLLQDIFPYCKTCEQEIDDSLWPHFLGKDIAEFLEVEWIHRTDE